MSVTIFAKIIAGEIPAKIVYEDELCLAFYDANPVAPTHILVIPKKPLVNISNCEPEDVSILGSLLVATAKVTAKLGIEDYRVVINNGSGAQQTVMHLHLHILAGREFRWPPG